MARTHIIHWHHGAWPLPNPDYPQMYLKGYESVRG